MTTEVEPLYDQRVFLYDDYGIEKAPISSFTTQSATKGKEHRRNEVFPALCELRKHTSAPRATYTILTNKVFIKSQVNVPVSCLILSG